MLGRLFPESLFPRKLDPTAERRIRLAQARAEESVIRAHVDNALMFVDTLAEDLPFDRAIDTYIRVMGIPGAAREHGRHAHARRAGPGPRPVPPPRARRRPGRGRLAAEAAARRRVGRADRGFAAPNARESGADRDRAEPAECRSASDPEALSSIPSSWPSAPRKSRRSARLTRNITATMHALITHHMQIASITNSSRYVSQPENSTPQPVSTDERHARTRAIGVALLDARASRARARRRRTQAPTRRPAGRETSPTGSCSPSRTSRPRIAAGRCIRACTA